MANLSQQLRGLVRHSARWTKRCIHRLRFPAHSSVPVFILGCQRSGTKMLLNTLARAPDVWAHDHRRRDPVYMFRHDPAYAGASRGEIERLAPVTVLRRMIDRSRSPVLAIHAISDSQRADELLVDFPQARLMWIYRHYRDVANSAVAMWGDHQKDVIQRICDGQWDRLKWRGERLAEEDVETVRELYQDNLTSHDGAALIWYLRNQLYFRRNLNQHRQVFLVNYEQLVTDPVRQFTDVFAHIGSKFDERFVRHIFASSVSKQPPAVFDERVDRACARLLQSLSANCGSLGPGIRPTTTGRQVAESAGRETT